MSRISSASAILSILSLTSAFPFLPSLDERASVIPFDAASQYVSNKGANAFIAPGAGDSRSPCPALNVMANHGYIPRNGFVTQLQIEQALPQVFGLSPDLASVLSLIFLGTTTKNGAYDIGGFPKSLVGVTPTQFTQTYNIGTINSDNPMQQICTNYNAIDGAKYGNADFFSQGGAINDELFFRAFANKSAEYPLGSLDSVSKLAMLAMTPNGDGTFTWHKFQNAIPDDWYKQNALAPFSTPLFGADMVEEGIYGCSPGQNYGSADMALLTNGVYTNQALLNPKTNMCFLSQAAPIVLPLLAKFPNFSATTRQNVATAVSGFQKSTQSLDCSAYNMKSMNLVALGKVLGLNLASVL